MSYDKERRIAIEAVMAASRLCRAVAAGSGSGQAMAKADRSPVTVADFGSQAVVSLALEAAFPDDPVVGEEDAAELRQASGEALRAQVVTQVAVQVPGLGAGAVLDAIDRCAHPGGATGRFWTLDPIDGTKGFLRGEQYAVALALLEAGVPVLGVLGCPNLPLEWAHPEGGRGCLFVAVSGEGTTMVPLAGGDQRRVRASAVTDPAAAAFVESVESGHSSHADSARIATLLGVTAPPVRIDSQCKYAAVARGDAAIYLRLPSRKDYREKIWDHAAGYRVVVEAGGRVSDAHGRPLDFSLGRTLDRNQGVIATNGVLHDRVVAAAAEVVHRP